MNSEEFLKLAEKQKPKKHAFLHSILAFLCGGIIGLLGQLEYNLLIKYGQLDQKSSLILVSITFIFISVFLTFLGAYKKLGQIFGAGLFIPITGFANSMASAAIEYRSEGPIFGLGSKMFSLAGSVVVYGILAAFFYALIYFLLMKLGIVYAVI